MKERLEMRLTSLDLMRGGVMLTLTVIQPLLWAVHQVFGLPSEVMAQAMHADWVGMRVWDLVMPFFIFMCGTALPFALPKRLENGRPTKALWWHLVERVALLWVLGMFIQGNLLSFQWRYIYFYTNTLQAIAAGYFFATLLLLLPYPRVRAVLPLVLAGVYGGLLACYGDYSQQGNLAIVIDKWCFPSGNGDPKYAWVLTTLMFTAMTLLGAQCGAWLKAEGAWVGKTLKLVALGCATLFVGWVLSVVEPLIKPIYTVSFTALAMGCAVLTLAGCYAVADGLGFSKGWGLITLFGRYALVAYVLREGFHGVLGAVSHRLFGGLPHLIGGDYQPLILALGEATILILLLYAWQCLTRKIA